MRERGSLLLFLILVWGLGVLMVSTRQNYKSVSIPSFALPKKTWTGALSISALKNGQYPGSKIKIEENLEPGSNYQRYLASYRSEDLKIYAYLTVPEGEPPAEGWPAIVFNHGYIPPAEYRSTERYVAYVDRLARAGYVVFRPDYRGHGMSEGLATGAYSSDAYTADILNALASLQKYPGVNVNRIGMWGHSLGGHLTLRSLVVQPNIKAAVIWAGVVASYPDLLNNWRGDPSYIRPTLPPGRLSWRKLLIDRFGTPREGSPFWDAISATAHLKDVKSPIQLHHGTEDTSVPANFSTKLEQKLKAKKKTVELYLYEGDDHNLSQNFSLAMDRTISFFDYYLKDRPE